MTGKGWKAALLLALTLGTVQAAPVRNVVLVHGAFMDASCWRPVMQRLQQRGFSVTAVQNPLTSLADDAEATRQVLAQQNGPTLLVGFSWGGAVIGEVGDDAKVAGLVYVAALAPDVGESVGSLMQSANNDAASSSASAIADAGQGKLMLQPKRFAAVMAHDLNPGLARALAYSQQPIARQAFAEPASQAAWHAKPSWYAVSTQDRALAPKLQWQMAERIQATTSSLPTSHSSILTRPAQIAALIERAAQSLER